MTLDLVLKSTFYPDSFPFYMQGVVIEPNLYGVLIMGWVMGFTSKIPFN